MKTPKVKTSRTSSKRAAKAAPAPVLRATFQSVLAELAGAFVQDKRNDGVAFYKVSDTAPNWVRNDGTTHARGECLMLRLHSAIDDRGPDDWVYQHIMLAAERLLDYCEEYTTAETMRDKGDIAQVADSLVDVYNAELTKWLSLHLSNIELCDEAVEENGPGSAGGVLGYIQAGQYRALEAIASAIVNEVEKELEERNEALTSDRE